MAKYFIIPTNGPELEIDGGDFLKIKRRFKNATSGAWEINGEINTGSVVQLQNIIAIVPRLTAEEAKVAAQEKKKEIDKNRALKLKTHPELKKPEKDDFDKCELTHRVDPAERKFEKGIVCRKSVTPQGVVRYFPVCTKCGWKGQLIKAAAIPKTFDMQPEEVPEYVEGTE